MIATAAAAALGVEAARRDLDSARAASPDPIQVSTLGEDVNGVVAIEEDGAEGISAATGYSAWADQQPMRLRVSRADPDVRGAQHFMVIPYEHGLALEYGSGVIEVWAGDLSVHGNGSALEGARFWVGNHTDLGGLRISASNQGETYAELAAQGFSGAEMGDIRFVVRGANDFQFRAGPADDEQTVATITSDGQVRAAGDVTTAGGVTAEGQIQGERIFAEGRVVARRGLAVGNSQRARNLGRVVRRIPVFDTHGKRLGFVPVYDRIRK